MTRRIGRFSCPTDLVKRKATLPAQAEPVGQSQGLRPHPAGATGSPDRSAARPLSSSERGRQTGELRVARLTKSQASRALLR